MNAAQTKVCLGGLVVILSMIAYAPWIKTVHTTREGFGTLTSEGSADYAFLWDPPEARTGMDAGDLAYVDGRLFAGVNKQFFSRSYRLDLPRLFLQVSAVAAITAVLVFVLRPKLSSLQP